MTPQTEGQYKRKETSKRKPVLRSA